MSDFTSSTTWTLTPTSSVVALYLQPSNHQSCGYQQRMTAERVSDSDVFQDWKEAARVSSPPQDSGKADCQSASRTKTSQPFKFITARLYRLLVSPLQVCAQAAIVQIFKTK